MLSTSSIKITFLFFKFITGLSSIFSIAGVFLLTFNSTREMLNSRFNFSVRYSANENPFLLIPTNTRFFSLKLSSIIWWVIRWSFFMTYSWFKIWFFNLLLFYEIQNLATNLRFNLLEVKKLGTEYFLPLTSLIQV